MQQDAFAPRYGPGELLLLGQAIKYAGLMGKEVRIVPSLRQPSYPPLTSFAVMRVNPAHQLPLHATAHRSPIRMPGFSVEYRYNHPWVDSDTNEPTPIGRSWGRPESFRPAAPVHSAALHEIGTRTGIRSRGDNASGFGFEGTEELAIKAAADLLDQ
jgi:hypothetical protein